MRCNECDEPAAYAPEHGNIKVGLCEEHFKEYIAAFERSFSIDEIER